MALIGLPQLTFVFVAVLVAWAILRRREPFDLAFQAFPQTAPLRT